MEPWIKGLKRLGKIGGGGDGWNHGYKAWRDWVRFEGGRGWVEAWIKGLER